MTFDVRLISRENNEMSSVPLYLRYLTTDPTTYFESTVCWLAFPVLITAEWHCICIMARNAVRKERCSAHYFKNVKTVLLPADCISVQVIVS